MGSTVSMRLSEGVYLAVKEISEKIGSGMGISDTATLIFLLGMDGLKHDSLSPKTLAIMEADRLETQASWIRTVAKLTPEQGKLLGDWLGGLVAKLESVFKTPPQKIEAVLKSRK